MAKNNKNNKVNTNKQKSIVIPKNFLEQYKIKQEGVLNGLVVIIIQDQTGGGQVDLYNYLKKTKSKYLKKGGLIPKNFKYSDINQLSK